MSTALIGCSSDDSTSSTSEDLNQKTTFNQIDKVVYDDVMQDSKGWLVIEGKTYFINENDEEGEFLTKFDNRRAFETYITSDFETDYSEVDEGIIITELKSGDQLTIENYELIDGYSVFDVRAGDRFFENIKYQANISYDEDEGAISVRVCWPCVVVIAKYVVESIADALTDSDCQTAIKQCTEAGGFPETEISEGIFKSTCKVKCVPKPKETKSVRFRI